MLSRPVFLALVASAALACGAESPSLDIATTTSVQNSGLLDAALPLFSTASVRVHPAGSGRSLAMLADGVVGAVISHAPEAEARYLAERADWLYRKLAFNRFVVVGPPDDPARIKASADVVDAFRRIAQAPVDFISRGDASGTHEREQALWKAAGILPASERLLISGQSMALALRHANERRAYTLTDEATYWQLRDQLALLELFAGDPRLANTYAVIYREGHVLAAAFAEWLTRGDGREAVAAFRIGARPAFTIWPLTCPDDRPELLPCS